MGGGVSVESLEEVLIETLNVGRAFVAVAFPGMHKIYDFHSSKGPKLRNTSQYAILGVFDSDDEESDNEEDEKRRMECESENMFKVRVGRNIVYIEDVCAVNDSGWVALHACCMSFQTVDAAFALIDEMVRVGGSLDVKTVIGPGAFNSGWTPLHMACAYGIEPIVNKLIENGADVNTKNSFLCTPLLDSCHRGFLNIVVSLVKGGADVSYNPSTSSDTMNSPFMCSPSQCALAEAARCGYNLLVQFLIDAGADKDAQNHIGWTALHEACFFNRIETVKVLLMHGADASLRTKCGALPYHLCAIQVIRTMISEMGGSNAVPKEGDDVDMMTVMQELTYGSGGSEDGEGALVGFNSGDGAPRLLHNTVDDTENSDSKETSVKKKIDFNSVKAETPLLHTGGIIGNLPDLTKSTKGKGTSPSKAQAQFDNAYDAVISDNPNRNAQPSLLGDVNTNDFQGNSGVTKSKKSKKKRQQPEVHVPENFPKEFLCELSGRPLEDPVRTTYGNVYERKVILDWIKNQGHICPMTGAPLGDSDLKDAPELREKVVQWFLAQSMGASSNKTEELDSSAAPKDQRSGLVKRDSKTAAKAPSSEDDLYNF